MKQSIVKRISLGEARTGATIQKALDEASASGGGTVELPAAIYDLHGPIRLRDNVRLVGEKGAVLRKVPSVGCALADYLGYGHYEVTVTEPEKFPVGTGIHIFDDNAPGFYTTCAMVVARDGNALIIDRMLNHDYVPANNARAVSAFALIEVVGVHDVGLENVTLDGNVEETFALNGCRGGGIFMLGSQRVEIKNVEVTHYRGDAISFQQSTDVAMRNCHVHHNVYGGLHPGSGTVRYVMENNDVHDNGCCGIFYCLRTTHSICQNNRVVRNGMSGICIGERDTDHLLRGNTIAENGGNAIELRQFLHRGADRVRIESNQLGPNARPAEIDIAGNLHDIEILDNQFHGSAKPLAVASGCSRIYFSGNRVEDAPATARDIAGDKTAVTLERPARSAVEAPHMLGQHGARHLNIERLQQT